MTEKIRNRVLFPLLAGALGLFLAFVILEAASYLFPVSEQPFLLPVTKDEPIARYTPNQSFTFSNFADFAIINQSRSNNWGFINDQDYETASPLPLLAVVGDSFVEALMVPYRETINARLAEGLAGKARVYSFAKGGAALGQYLAYADFAKRTFHPTKMIIVIIDNDYDKSLDKYRRAPGQHQFFEDGRGGLELRLTDYPRDSLPMWLTRHSRLMKYLIRNVKIDALQELVRGDKDQFVRPVEEGQAQVLDSKRAVDAFLRLLPEAAGLGPGRILFVLDGMRPHLYSEQELARVGKGYSAVMRNYFMAQVRARGYDYLDMQPVFMEDYRQRGRRFEFAKDTHWNSYGHEVVFRAVAATGFLTDLDGPGAEALDAPLANDAMR